MKVSRLPPIRAISFDAGDTLIFDDPPISERIAAALHASGLISDPASLPDAVRGMQRLGVSLYLRGCSLSSPQLIGECTRKLLAGLKLPADDEQAREVAKRYAAQPYRQTLIDGALPLIEELKARGFLITLISDWEPDLLDLLGALELTPLLDCVSVSSIVGATKPAPKLFQNALDCLSLPGESVLHVGDYAELDCAGAQSVGMNAVLFDKRGLYTEGGRQNCLYASTFAELSALLLELAPPTEAEITASAGIRLVP